MKYKVVVTDENEQVLQIEFNDEALAAFIGRQFTEFISQAGMMQPLNVDEMRMFFPNAE